MGQTDIIDYRHNRLAWEGFAEALLRNYEVALPEPEGLGEPGDLDRFLLALGHSFGPSTVGDVAETRALRERLRRIFDGNINVEQRSAELNAMLSDTPVRLVLDPRSHTLDFALPVLNGSLVERVSTLSVVSLALAVSQFGYSRLRICEADPCRDAFVDTSKKGSRRFCGAKCASRWHVAAFRDRKKTGKGDEGNQP
ncbi:hypothetical protein C6558_32415 [Ensifer sp. NM-2]|uniref:CGNR zinc finger domain-containing protein n=1 Tax=Ensifer sp. NM-2 TaxID=2109730 RepID=UPI000D12D61F|nr:CGNR zinc finger domain-containing protein [Ensifer sp. NM-2]PSS60516.1 hypothetical protein C6558_32415 [Ensifer sp. NM-2]